MSGNIRFEKVCEWCGNKFTAQTSEHNEGAINQSSIQICNSITDFKDDFHQMFEDFKSYPPVHKVKKTIRVARE